MSEPVAIYARYSTDRQNSRSSEDQLAQCRAYAARHGWEVTAEYSDDAVSGAHTDRRGLQRMLDAASRTKRSPFRAVIVDDLARLSRDLGDTWRIIFTDLAAVDVRVVDVSTGMSSDAKGARTTFAAMAMVNDTFLQLVKHETHRGLDVRAKAGFSTGGSLYGYETHAEPNPTDPEHPRRLWAIDEATEAPIVRRIYSEYEDGAGYKTIADRLNRGGVAPPRNNGRGGKHGGGWTAETVRAILRNPKYVGMWTWNTTKSVRVPGRRARRQVARPKSEHVVREHPDLAIIDRPTWDRVQARLKRHAGHGKRHHMGRPARYPYLLGGLLRCGTCGGSMSVVGQKKKDGVRYASLGCIANRSRGDSICNNTQTISEKKITEAFLAALAESITDQLINRFVARVMKLASTSTTKDARADLAKQLAEAEQGVANVTALLVRRPDSPGLLDQLDRQEQAVARFKAELAAATLTKLPIRAKVDPAKVRQALRGYVARLGDLAPELGREVIARALVKPLSLTPKSQNPGRGYHVTGALALSELEQQSQKGRVAGARLLVLTPGSDSGFRSKPSRNVSLEKEDFAFLDWLVKMAIETLIPSAKSTCSLAMIDELDGDCAPAGKRRRRTAH